MKIEVGKKYKTRGGWMAEVIRNSEGDWRILHGGTQEWWHNHDGTICGGHDPSFDLIAPWEEPMTKDKLYDLQLKAMESLTDAINKMSEPPLQTPDTAAIRRQYACASLTGVLAADPQLNYAQAVEHAIKLADAMMEAEKS